MDQTTSQPQPSSQPEPLESPSIPPHKNKTLMFVALVVGLFVVLGSISGGIWAYTQGKKEVHTLVKVQTQHLDDLKNSYDDIRDILDEIPTTPSIDNADLLDASDQSNIPSSFDDVLGVEEQLGIDQNRKLSEKYKTASKHLEALKKNNRKVEALARSNPVVSLFVPQNADLIADTDRFSDNSTMLISYLQKLNTFEINSTMVGYQIGLAIQEAIVRSADDDSVANLDKKIEEIDKLYEEFKAIDIENIPENLQNEHKDELSEFNADVEVFNQLLTAFQEKDTNLLEKSFQSLILQGQGASNESEVKFKTFWHENEILNAVSDLSDRWEEYGTLIGVSE